MRVCVLRSSYEDSASPIATLDPYQDPSPWLDGHAVSVHTLRREGAADAVRALCALGFDVFINLCDGMWFEDIAGIEVVRALEDAGVAFTGANARLYALSKAAMKARAVELEVPTPACVFAGDRAALERAGATLRFPLIVKHVDGCGSMGMTRASRVRDERALIEQGLAMIAVAGGALVEEFVEGDEYTALVVEDAAAPAGAHVYAPMKCRFPPGETFKHFELKWRDFEALQWEPCEDAALAARIAEASRTVFVGLGGESFSRRDFRVDPSGTPWFLEINTNCGVFYPPGAEGSADMILRRDAGGHRAFVQRILAAAKRRAR